MKFLFLHEQESRTIFGVRLETLITAIWFVNRNTVPGFGGSLTKVKLQSQLSGSPSVTCGAASS